MKGIVELKLKDKNGNVVHEEKKHNTVTGFFAEYFRQLGPTKELPYNYTVENAIGGILLFQNSISGTPIRLPHGNKMIGNGCVGVTNASGTSVSELGSYVSAECKWVDANTYQQKFEWTPSQAVGTIGCVCLTSKGWGYIGEGNETSNGCLGNSSYAPNYMDLGSQRGKKTVNKTLAGFDMTNKLAIHVDTTNLRTGGTLTVENYYFPVDSINFKDGVLENSVLVSSRNVNVPAEYVADVSEISCKCYGYLDDGDASYFTFADYGQFYSSQSYYQSATDTHPYVYCVKLKSGADSITRIEIPSTVRNEIYAYNTGRPMFTASYNGTYLVIVPCAGTNTASGKSQYIYIFNVSAGTYVRVNNCFTDSSYADASVEQYYDSQFYVYKQSQLAKIDAIKQSASRMNATSNMQSGITTGYPLAKLSRSGDSVNFTRNSHYLATIYNLSTPVTKTADLSLEITYTLTFGD